jgi:diguanylate cyclase (GGDEF)-like protein
MIEVDRFHEIRDQYGYLAGDEVLTAIATTLSDNVSHHDAIARFTGAEFVILLPNLTENAALHVAEDIREAIMRQRVPVINLRKRTAIIRGLTVSIGVAPYPASGFAVHKVLAAANTALDYAKQLGHNRVRLANTA